MAPNYVPKWMQILSKSPQGKGFVRYFLKQKMTHGNPDNTMVVRNSRWQWESFKDDLHFWVFFFGTPMVALAAYTNFSIGEATLKVIPEGYTPQEHEYAKKPITRFLIQNFFMKNEQETYESHLHCIWEGFKRREQNLLRQEVLRQIRNDGDSMAYYHHRYDGRDFRIIRKDYMDTLKDAGLQDLKKD